MTDTETQQDGRKTSHLLQHRIIHNNLFYIWRPIIEERSLELPREAKGKCQLLILSIYCGLVVTLTYVQ